MTTALFLERAALFESAGAVQTVLVAVVDLIAAHSSWSGIWVDGSTAFAQLTEKSVQRIVVDSIYIGAASPGAPTHVFDLFAAPTPQPKMSRVCLNLRVATGERAFPGMRLIAELNHEVFGVSPARLLVLLAGAVGAIGAGFASVGTRAAAGQAQWANDELGGYGGPDRPGALLLVHPVHADDRLSWHGDRVRAIQIQQAPARPGSLS